MGAVAFQKGLGAIHALSHPVGAIYNTHHGTTNATVMPPVLTFNRPAVEDRLAEAAAAVALEMGAAVAGLRTPTGVKLGVRIGLNSGPVMAGVIGKSKFSYDLWGDAVNVAARMESTGEPGMVQLTEATRRALPPGHVSVEAREGVEVKGKGAMRTWVVQD